MVFVVAAMLILAYCSDVACSATYQDVMYTICGRRVQLVTAFSIAVYSYGTCITFLIIIGDQLDNCEFCTFSKQNLSRIKISIMTVDFSGFLWIHGPNFTEHWYMNRSYTIPITSIILILPLCFPKRIDFLKYIRSVCEFFYDCKIK